MVSHRKPAKPAFDPRTVKENIVETPLNEEMSKSFLEYAYSVIYARALPDARDGLKRCNAASSIRWPDDHHLIVRI